MRKRAGYRQVQHYARRMRMEATFQDSKSRGFNIEASWIEDRAHLDRFLLALSLAIWWTRAFSCQLYPSRATTSL